MAETTAESSATFKPVDFIDQIYDQTNAACSRSIAFDLFDVRLCGALDFGWLLQQVECFGVKEQELKQFIDSGLIKTWTDEEDIRGFLRYTPEQVKTLKSLQKLDRYGAEELQHVMSSWDADIDFTLEVPPYDNPDPAKERRVNPVSTGTFRRSGRARSREAVHPW